MSSAMFVSIGDFFSVTHSYRIIETFIDNSVLKHTSCVWMKCYLKGNFQIG